MRFAIIVFPGTSCEVDMYRAITNVVVEDAAYVWHTDATDLSEFDAVLLPTGAAYGDYVRPGALAVSSPAIQGIRQFAASGKPVLGVGNGFQILVEADLLPGAFLKNRSLKFQSGVASVTVQNTATAFTNEYEEKAQLNLPFAHAYGNYFVDQETLAKLQQQNQIVLTYDEDDFGSTVSIAGVMNEAGNVLGMMVLPERAVEQVIGGTDGLSLFTSLLKNGSEINA